MSKNNTRRWGSVKPRRSKRGNIVKAGDFGRLTVTVAHSPHNHVGLTGSLDSGGRERMYHATKGWRTRRSVV